MSIIIGYYEFISDQFYAALQDPKMWMILVGILLAYTLGFAMGANDVANAFGTSVGSGALTIVQAYILASIFETLGACLLGYNVIDTIRKGVVDVTAFQNQTDSFLLGQVATLGGCSMWLIIATIFNMPVSSTHSIVGAVLGFVIVSKGFGAVKWKAIFKIVASWFISPILAGFISLLVFMMIDHVILRKKDPVKHGFIWIPIFSFLCIAANIFVVLFQGSRLIYLPPLSWWLCSLISTGVGLLSAGLCFLFVVPYLRNKMLKEPDLEPFFIGSRLRVRDNSDEDSSWKPPRHFPKPNLSLRHRSGRDVTKKMFVGHFPRSKKRADRSSEGTTESTVGSRTETTTRTFTTRSLLSCDTTTARSISASESYDRVDDLKNMSWFKRLMPQKDALPDEKILMLFGSIQILTACCAGFAHGANDVANSIAPLVALMNTHRDNDVSQKLHTSPDVLMFGVFSICAGLWILGHRVIQTVGVNMTDVNPINGFSMEFGAAMTAIIASKLGLPISTTHCIVGAVVIVGFFQSRHGVDWKLMRNIVISWLVTVPLAGVFSGAIYAALWYTMF